jgi:hypothetical protein
MLSTRSEIPPLLTFTEAPIYGAAHVSIVDVPIVRVLERSLPQSDPDDAALARLDLSIRRAPPCIAHGSKCL